LPTQDQGFACNVADPNGGLVDCPQGTTACFSIANAPANLGICNVPLVRDGGAPKDASGDGLDAAAASDH
jgi:hypothetical protein